MEMIPMPVEPERSAGKSSTNLVLIILVAILLLGNGATLYFLLKKPAKVQESIINTVVTNDNVNQENATTTDNNLFQGEKLPPIDLGQAEIPVTWLDTPIVVPVEDFIKMSAGYEKLNNSTTTSSLPSYSIVKKVGTVSSGKNIDKEVYLVAVPEMGYSFKRVIKDGNNLVMLGKQSDYYMDAGDSQIFNLDSVSVISNLNIPDTISIPNTKYKLYKRVYTQGFFEDYDDLEKAFSFGENNFVYKSNKLDCFIVRANDGTAWKYIFDLSSINAKKDVNYAEGVYSIVLDAPFGTDNEYGLTNFRGGCSADCYAYIKTITSISQLNKIATNSKGEIFYTLKNKEQKLNTSDTKSILQTIYDNHYQYVPEGQTKMSYDDFLKLSDYPVIIWKDPLGNFMLLVKVAFGPAAECGKPVIYLYPTKTTDVSVRVNPTGGFTKTEPDYGTGWLVKAEPNGNLYNYQDKKNYPYLFWEGYGLNYQMSNEGFVVAKNDVNKFLREKLAIQGLNEKEINDFLEFWLPRMQSDPYYFVTFVPQAEFDKMAPLTVSPKPDSVIRVFMDFRALDKPIQVKEQKLPAQGGSALGGTPQRTGFTVVEWGGELQK